LALESLRKRKDAVIAIFPGIELSVRCLEIDLQSLARNGQDCLVD
jgi:hypothetical protein